MSQKLAAALHGIRQCPHGFHHPNYPHSCDGCWCEGEHDRAQYGWAHNTDPRKEDS